MEDKTQSEFLRDQVEPILCTLFTEILLSKPADPVRSPRF